MSELGVILPPGVTYDPPAQPERGTIVNETDLPDQLVHEAVATHLVENASVLGVNQGSTFQTYANEGSLLARSKYRTPRSVFEEIALARDLAERDDDVAATLGTMLSTAFGDEMQHTHKDEVTVALFNEVAKHAGIDHVFHELYREWLISGSVTTAALFTRETFQFQPEGSDRQRSRTVTTPLIGVLPAEQIRVVDNDLFNTGTLAYKPATAGQEKWLLEFFSERTTPARKAEMRREDPVLATLLVEELAVEDVDGHNSFTSGESLTLGQKLYRLNPRLVHRSTMPKGAWKYPRPLLTRNFALLEAKRLLNIMDYALLQGGSNFLVVAKKGSDTRPAMPAEVDNLHDVIRRASKTGVIIGDHRLAIEIITPKLDELLNPAKRKLIGRKLAAALLRVPDFTEADSAGGQAVLAGVEMLTRVIADDRKTLRRHVEDRIYSETVKRNSASFEFGAARIWFPKIILSGTSYFTDYILKMRDRGDIPRRYAVEAGGFDYDAAVQQRRREKANGDDRIMTPAQVPFSSPNQGPQDNGPGRPPGASSNNGRPGARSTSAPGAARPRQVIQRNAGETVTAMWDEETGETFRVGELTYAVLEQFEDTKEVGRVTAFERAGLARIERGEFDPIVEGPLTIVPVNHAYEIGDMRAVRLTAGLSVIVGSREEDDALVARAFCFRTPEFSKLDAQETAIKWGYPTPAIEADVIALPAPRDSNRDVEEEEHASAELAPVIHLHVDTGKGKTKRTVLRDEDGNIIGTEDEPVEDD